MKSAVRVFFGNCPSLVRIGKRAGTGSAKAELDFMFSFFKKQCHKSSATFVSNVLPAFTI
jgi:hypothetical protein